ncbi:KAP family NTPase [Shewanella sp. D64]|uniref:P-loop NTPase fold protein n=1 Tax=unclassified Shewanella TaxID=196818 RepID=UPI0022BA4CCE|nr:MULTISPECIES: P-loop NTPase fold protein [unclassified Shewanella]MEC4724296.1 KAP family NTPase [Shewanella sp. D64]MEC4738808.1 KAP family NTPase [Shewanella sp. E94]WBJ97753.1 KAP family NTPase [Shewanella sp. MTB7]
MFKRWFDLLCLSVVAATALYFLHPLIQSKTFLAWTDFITKQPYLVQAALYFSSGLLIKQLLNVTGDYSIEQESPLYALKRLKYPPARYAIFLVVIHIMLYLQFSDLLAFTMVLTFSSEMILLLIFILLGIVWCGGFTIPLRWVYAKFRSNTVAEKPVGTVCVNRMSDWLNTDDSSQNLDDDLLNRKALVERITERLNKSGGCHRGNHMLAGVFGSGKSSVIHFVKDQLRKENKEEWLFCTFDSWGRIKDGLHGQKLILEMMINEIGRVTSVVGLQGLPDAYLGALSGLGSNWKRVVSFLKITNLNPDKQLQEIEFILNCLDLKMLVCIEDLDRNNDSKNLANEIAPLLDRLVKIKNVSFIFTIGYEEHLSPVVTRVTQYREDLVIDGLKLESILTDFRKECFVIIDDFNPLSYIDGTKNPDSWKFVEQYVSSADYASTNRIYFNFLVLYFSSIRSLKYILRDVIYSWEHSKLAGEVNFDDLLLMTILKFEEPLAYDFIVENKNIVGKGLGLYNDKMLLEQWSLIEGELNNLDSAKAIVGYIINLKYMDKSAKIGGLNDKSGLMQCIGANRDKKYLNSIIANSIEFGEKGNLSDFKIVSFIKYLLDNMQGLNFDDAMGISLDKYSHLINHPDFYNTIKHLCGIIDDNVKDYCIIFSRLALYELDVIVQCHAGGGDDKNKIVDGNQVFFKYSNLLNQVFERVKGKVEGDVMLIDLLQKITSKHVDKSLCDNWWVTYLVTSNYNVTQYSKNLLECLLKRVPSLDCLQLDNLKNMFYSVRNVCGSDPNTADLFILDCIIKSKFSNCCKVDLLYWAVSGLVGSKTFNCYIDNKKPEFMSIVNSVSEDELIGKDIKLFIMKIKDKYNKDKLLKFSAEDNDANLVTS